MRIELRDIARRRLGRIRLESGEQPTRARVESDRAQTKSEVELETAEVFLQWDGALDDAGKLRRCISCGCRDLFQEKAFPQVTGIVVVLAFAGAVAGIFGFVTDVPVLTAMVVVLALDIWILLFSKRRLVCYRCRTSYHDLPIARYHRSWERSVAERYPAPASDSSQQTGPPTENKAAPTGSSRAPRRLQQEGFSV
ncbi:MAG TPA: hypothetical protein PK400_13495 [Phycisphaerales bacterium]|nr:hypothetical protein [Phycisphaerales bacterium]HRQ76659.1 hypothetical protein [Phycisphaerales bacterium]